MNKEIFPLYTLWEKG